MASTQYQIFCRYLNESINRALTNRTSINWISAEKLIELQKVYTANKTEYDKIKAQLVAGTLKENQLDVLQLNIYTTCKEYEEVQDQIEKQQMAVEYCIVEPADSLHSDTTGLKAKEQAKRDLELYQYVIDEAKATNPKYDMVFIYDGIAYAESRTGKADYNPSQNDNSKQIPYLYYDRMKRIKLDPWFLYSTHASLNSAMIKAKELVNILGKDAVMIGKVVALDQYIEIV